VRSRWGGMRRFRAHILLQLAAMQDRTWLAICLSAHVFLVAVAAMPNSMRAEVTIAPASKVTGGIAVLLYPSEEKATTAAKQSLSPSADIKATQIAARTGRDRSQRVSESSVTDGLLAKQLASEEGVAELRNGGGRAIAGAGTNRPIDDIARLVNQYGGSPEDWSKITSTAVGHLQTHAYRYNPTNTVVELKSIIQ
jgi:hypothetical protein